MNYNCVSLKFSFQTYSDFCGILTVVGCKRFLWIIFHFFSNRLFHWPVCGTGENLSKFHARDKQSFNCFGKIRSLVTDNYIISYCSSLNPVQSHSHSPIQVKHSRFRKINNSWLKEIISMKFHEH